jgi:hypothetical protein
MVMYLTPLILMPLEMTCFGSLLSEKEAAIALRSSSETFSHISISALVWCSRGSGPNFAYWAVRRAGGRTLKPGDWAQMALPAASQMTALSRLPGPMRLVSIYA